jgi:hypothetical protein
VCLAYWTAQIISDHLPGRQSRRAIRRRSRLRLDQPRRRPSRQARKSPVQNRHCAHAHICVSVDTNLKDRGGNPEGPGSCQSRRVATTAKHRQSSGTHRTRLRILRRQVLPISIGRLENDRTRNASRKAQGRSGLRRCGEQRVDGKACRLFLGRSPASTVRY